MVGRHRCGPRFPSTAQSRRSDPELAYEIARAAGCRTAKVKVAERGQSLAEDASGWKPYATRWARTGRSGSTPTEAGAWMRRCMPFGSWIASILSMSSSRAPASTSWPICGAGWRDLGCMCQSPPMSPSGAPRIRTRWRSAQAADIAVLKVQPLGGVRACLQIAERIGLPVVVSSALETSIGIRAGPGAGRCAA